MSRGHDPIVTFLMIKVVDLYKSFPMGGRELVVLNHINLEIKRGEFIAIVGASGAGKSTLLHILGTLDRPTKGTVSFDGQDLFQLGEQEQADFRNKRVGFVFQFHHLLPEFTALENACLPAMIQQRDPAETQSEATSLLQEVGLGERLHHKPGELSGGEQQRVSVARALMQRPDLVLADEPTGNLDTHTGDALFGLLRQLNRSRNTTFVIVTHNDKLSAQADRIIHMQDGMIL
ncbi:MAG TPA: ABC transporter ATP-binding protein [Nitrospiraceae bacterium]|jgi:lipoprotein-releasing system ATP-binding protein|nr:ABC transporter ATP-binding protein [Nitrospiraceae bacterium]